MSAMEKKSERLFMADNCRTSYCTQRAGIAALPIFHKMASVSTRATVQPLDLRAPARIGLPRHTFATDLPGQQRQSAIDRQRGTLLGGVNTAVEIGQPVGHRPRVMKSA